MEASAFDRLSRAFVTVGSRRRLLGLLGLLPLAGHLPDGTADVASAKRHGRNRGHRPGKGKDNRKGQRTGQPKGSERCQRTGELCYPFNKVCCPGLSCTWTAILFPVCQQACTSDEQCHQQYPRFNTSCKPDALLCSTLDKCCVAQLCLFDGDCPTGYTCTDLRCQRPG